MANRLSDRSLGETHDNLLADNFVTILYIVFTLEIGWNSWILDALVALGIRITKVALKCLRLPPTIKEVID